MSNQPVPGPGFPNGWGHHTNTPERRTLTCVYCGQEYPSGTPSCGADVKVLTDHIKVCEKHPMRKLQADYDAVRNAFAKFVEDYGKENLQKLLVKATTEKWDEDRIEAIKVLISIS